MSFRIFSLRPKGVFRINPAGIYLLKVNNRNTRTRCEICSKLTIKTPERRHFISPRNTRKPKGFLEFSRIIKWEWRRSGVFIVNFEHISHLVLVFLLLTLNMQLAAEKQNAHHIVQVFENVKVTVKVEMVL